jgi:hypothetical protein
MGFAPPTHPVAYRVGPSSPAREVGPAGPAAAWQDPFFMLPVSAAGTIAVIIISQHTGGREHRDDRLPDRSQLIGVK